MKKHHISLLLVLTLLFCAFTLGFFLGRNTDQNTITVSAVSTQPRHDRQIVVSSSLPAESDISFPININTATEQELSALPGIGPTLARRILEYRDLVGQFEVPAELLNVEGIGAGKLEAILDYITTGG